MIFSTTYKSVKMLPSLSQEEIVNTPEFYAMSLENILKSDQCPEHLKTILMAHPWGSRPNVIQVRPQDWRTKVPRVSGKDFHLDMNTFLRNGRNHVAKNLFEFRLFVVSFGDVVETEFLRGPVEIDTKEFDPWKDYPRFADHINYIEKKYETDTAEPNELMEYTSRDIHRISKHHRLGGYRLIIVSFECDEAIPEEGGAIGPSIREKK